MFQSLSLSPDGNRLFVADRFNKAINLLDMGTLNISKVYSSESRIIALSTLSYNPRRIAVLEGNESEDNLWHLQLLILEENDTQYHHLENFPINESVRNRWMYGSVLELQSGAIATCTTNMKNIHVIDTKTGSEKSLSFVNQGLETFRSMSLVKQLSREFVACSFIEQNFIKIYTINQSVLELISLIPLDFEPLRSLWIPSIEKLLLFKHSGSNEFYSIDISCTGDYIHKIHYSKKIHAHACCLLQNDQPEPSTKLAMYDGESHSLLFLELI